MRRGMVVNRKRVLRLMREDNLLGVQPAAFVVTTDSDPDQQVHLNLARRMKLTAINQLWVADARASSRPSSASRSTPTSTSTSTS